MVIRPERTNEFHNQKRTHFPRIEENKNIQNTSWLNAQHSVFRLRKYCSKIIQRVHSKLAPLLRNHYSGNFWSASRANILISWNPWQLKLKTQTHKVQGMHHRRYEGLDANHQDHHANLDLPLREFIWTCDQTGVIHYHQLSQSQSQQRGGWDS